MNLNLRMMTCCLLFFFVVSCGQESSQKERLRARFPPQPQDGKMVVWIDTDPSVLEGGHEVDDGLALIQAFHSPELQIRGISAVFGNAELEKTFPLAAELTSKFGPEGLDVYSGAAESAQLATETEASRALAAALEKEELIILALGPVTNIATVIDKRPDLVSRIRQIVAVAGRRPDQHFFTGTKQVVLRDLNFELDPAAFQVLLDSPVPLVLAPWEVSSKIRIDAEDVAKFSTGGPAARRLFQSVSDWLHYWESEFGAAGFHPFDTLAVGFLTHPLLFKSEELPVAIQYLPDDTAAGGETSEPVSEKPYLIASMELETTRRAQYCFAVSPRFKEILLHRLME